MKTRLLIVLMATFGTGGCILGEPNVYAIPAADAVQRLAAVHVTPSGSGPFFMLDLEAIRESDRRVVWDATGDMAHHRCELTVTPVDDASSRIDISCNGGGAGSGAAAGLEANMIRMRAIELVDATLDGRPFDPERANGATAGRWPADRVNHGDYADAVGDAIEMDREAHEAAADAAQ